MPEQSSERYMPLATYEARIASRLTMIFAGIDPVYLPEGGAIRKRLWRGNEASLMAIEQRRPRIRKLFGRPISFGMHKPELIFEHCTYYTDGDNDNIVRQVYSYRDGRLQVANTVDSLEDFGKAQLDEPRIRNLAQEFGLELRPSTASEYTDFITDLSSFRPENAS